MQEQNQTNAMALPENKIVKDKNQSLKVGMIIVSIIALCGVAFGIYSVVQSVQKDQQISDLKDQNEDLNGKLAAEKSEDLENENSDGSIIKNPEPTEKKLYMIGDLSTRRRYYFGTADLDPSQDAREKEIHLIDSTKLSSGNGVKEYDLKPVLEQALSDKVVSLPEILAGGTTNATPKSDCQSYKLQVGDPVNLPGNVDWTIAADWGNLLPLTIYTSCVMKNGGELSLGTGLYSLNPDTKELKLLADTVY